MKLSACMEPRRWRRMVVLATLVAILTGCASAFPNWRPDRCHRSEQVRDTLNWDIFCRQSP